MSSRNSRDRKNSDSASGDFGVNEFNPPQPAARYGRSPDVESQRSHRSMECRGSRSLRSWVSRGPTQSFHEKELKPIEEEHSDNETDTDVSLMAIKEARLDDEGINNQTIKQFKRNARRHKNIQSFTNQSKSVDFFRKLYDNIIDRALITRSLIWWLPVALIFFIPLAIDAWGRRDLYLGKLRIMWLFIWVEVSWGSLFVSRQFAHYMPGILGFFIAIIAPQYFFIIDSLIALEGPITLFFWLFITFITFVPITALEPDALQGLAKEQLWQHVLEQVLVAAFLCGLFYLIEQIFIHSLSVSYHRTRMAQRIKDNKQSKAIIAKLLFTSWEYFPAGSTECAEEDDTLASTVLATGDAGIKVKRMLGNKFDFSTPFKSAKKAIAGTIPVGFHPTEKTALRVVRKSLACEASREALGERIWKSLVIEGEDFLSVDDIMEFLEAESHEDTMFIFDMFGLDGRGGLSREELVTTIKNTGQETKNISLALQDMDGAFTKLHYLLLFVLSIIIIVIFVGMVAPSASTVLATMGTAVLGASFIFSATCQEILASCVFLFVKHPIDVGDIVQIDAGSVGHSRLIVRKINLLTTVFEDAAHAIIQQAPNSVLNTLFIDNITRSPPMNVLTHLTLGLPETTFAKLEEFRRKIEEFLAKNSRDYKPKFYYQVTDFPDLDRIKLTVIVTCRNNQVDMKLFSLRRTRFYEFVSRCVHDIPLHVPRRELKHIDPSVPMYVETAERSSTRPEREPMGMEKNDTLGGFDSRAQTPSISGRRNSTGLRKRRSTHSFNERGEA